MDRQQELSSYGARLALASRAPVRLGERCTVFMERDVNDCLRRGAELENVLLEAFGGGAHTVHRPPVPWDRRLGT